MFARSIKFNSNLLLSTARKPQPTLLRLRLTTLPSKYMQQQKMGQSTSSEQDPSSQFKTYKYDDILKLVNEEPEQGPYLIDVREPKELAELGKIPNALNIPYKTAPGSLDLKPEEFQELYSFEKPDENKELVFYCAAGIRARAAAELAQSFGYKHCSVYPGSFNEWMIRDGPIEK
ncbi:hypothetical protein ACO0QE_004476 [Hanseniaspora vineae]